MTRIIATFFYAGYLRPAPGTWGSLAALPVGWAVATLFGVWGFVVATVLVFVAGLWATQAETAGKEDHDPSEIVIDEVAGQWIALLPVIYGADMMNVSLLALYPGWIAAFVLFRLFDIWKPGPVGWADRRGDALGVMLDDVIAGIFAALVTIGLAALSHGLLMR
ncbi:phosphatidylglycerophosphatase A [Loktanella sp. IMCC34160]|uniref:phosphatidylglycerophosphatase A family protein n=1 Tax=Loktanella sp. IMCC34160 TaxID=2510646 RepID=UPI00101DD6AD|nr:phosphatidylglycerophosphatase A [Loktanella sp. IMCC34160]RYG92107.1 phosphatidylglycerophosphatase A [Loktanella sp. IMCC34160]